MNAFMQVAGWTLVHFLWQGAAIGLSIAVALRLTCRRSPNLRYLIACAGLLTMMAAPVATAYLLRPVMTSAHGGIALDAATSSTVDARPLALRHKPLMHGISCWLRPLLFGRMMPCADWHKGCQ